MIRFDQVARHAQVPGRHLVRTLKLPAGAAWTVSSFVNIVSDLSGHGCGAAYVP